MNAMLFAAGLGTRLRPYTDHCPKAMVKVDGIPMIAHQLCKLRMAGITHVVINVHHFAEQIINYVNANNGFGLKVTFSDERGKLLDTGGGIRKALPLFMPNEPVLVHNVDIFSNTDLNALCRVHEKSENDASLLVSRRDTSRYLVFDADDSLVAWKNVKTGEVRTANREAAQVLTDIGNEDNAGYRLRAFSGIHVISPALFPVLECCDEVFSIIDFYWRHSVKYHIRCVDAPADFRWVDAGKPEMLLLAAEVLKT
ncbi:MAG: nucleotidyltransferase family protein [Bacteroidales bacterium]|nr:nucleotidyltransferase family protein [Bacteroidales bacterium]